MNETEESKLVAVIDGDQNSANGMCATSGSDVNATENVSDCPTECITLEDALPSLLLKVESKIHEEELESEDKCILLDDNMDFKLDESFDMTEEACLPVEKCDSGERSAELLSEKCGECCRASLACEEYDSNCNNMPAEQRDTRLLSEASDAGDVCKEIEALENFSGLDISEEMEEIGLYAYMSLIALSLHMLFEYTSWNRSFQENCIKLLLNQLNLPKQTEETLLLMTKGDAKVECLDPFVDTVKEQAALKHHQPHIFVWNLLAVMLKTGCYDARLRALAKFISIRLGVSCEKLQEIENVIIHSFMAEEHVPTEEELKVRKQKERKQKFARYGLISLAAVGGGVVIGLTGGLAAPFIAAGAGVIVGSAGAAALGSVAGVAIIGSLFGAAGAGLAGYNMNKRVGGLTEFEFEPLSSGQSLHVTVAIPGWISSSQTDLKSTWLTLDNSAEQYVLHYESKYLRELGNMFEYLMSIGVTVAVQETLKHTILSGLVSAIAWPAALVSMMSVIDNPWHVCTQRSVLAGKQLANVLLSRQQGKRPVTLIGYSFGARVIFACLQELATHKSCEGIVEDVVLLGAPVSGSMDEWTPLSKVVAGRIVNGYCRSDWLLKFIYRTASVQLSVAGVSPVKWTHRLMQNIDLTQIVSGHFDYIKKMDLILEVVGIRTKLQGQQAGS